MPFLFLTNFFSHSGSGNFFYCSSTNQAIPSSLQCNGYADCPYAEDEMDCGNSNLVDENNAVGKCTLGDFTLIFTSLAIRGE